MPNWKQQAAAAIVAHTPPQAQGMSLDAELGQALEDCMPQIPPRDTAFALSLLAGFKRFGTFTPRQRPYVERLVTAARAPVYTVADQLAGEACVAAQEPAREAFNPPAATPPKAPARIAPRTASLFAPDRFSRFTVGKVQLSRSNDGALVWIKHADYRKVVGAMDLPEGRVRLFSRLMGEDRGELEMTLDRIEADPQGAAAEDGLRTGRCSCCGRELTDPVSIAMGIGPICANKF
jgi:hypothetical protein